MPLPRLALLVALAMLAFAANSLLCRIALRDGHVDAASFTAIRLLGGALALWLIVRLRIAAAPRVLAGSNPECQELFRYRRRAGRCGFRAAGGTLRAAGRTRGPLAERHQFDDDIGSLSALHERQRLL